MKIDLIKQLIEEFENSKVHKMKIEIEDLKLELEKPGTSVTHVEPQNVTIAPTATPTIEETASTPEPVASGQAIKSPIVGVFYRSSSPTAKPFVEVGDKVTKGQVLCIVEAMKVMNEIKSPFDGVVSAVMADNDDLVEFDQILMMIEG
ncbi:MAG: acetyl-CoA carboxylase biotin carboxyl carrier protein [Coprobacillaceae bacterium]